MCQTAQPTVSTPEGRIGLQSHQVHLTMLQQYNI